MGVRLEFVRHRHERGGESFRMKVSIGLRFWVWVVIRSSIEFPLSRLTGEGDRG